MLPINAINGMPMNLNHPSFNFGEAMQQFNAIKHRELTQRIHLSFKRSFRKMKRSFYTKEKKPMVIAIANKQIKQIPILSLIFITFSVCNAVVLVTKKPGPFSYPVYSANLKKFA
jgi:hypothetical protein